MKKNILCLSLALLVLGFAGVTFAAPDHFLRNLEICNSYKTVYKSPLTGEFFEKGVLGVKTESTTRNLHCFYYKQMSKNEYQLCNIRTSSLNTDSPFDKKVNCKMVDIQKINLTQQEIENKDMMLDINTDILHNSQPTQKP